VPEELTAGQGRHDRRAIENHEWPFVRPPIEPVDQLGHKFLAGAALAGEENGGLREGCHLDDLAQDGDPSGAIANESVPDLI